MAPNEERLANLIQQFPELNNPITDYLQAKPDDSEAEGRFKNALEGLMVGLVAEPFMRSLRLLKYARFKAPIIEVRTKVHYRLEADTIEKSIIEKEILNKKLDILTPKEVNQLTLEELKQSLPEGWQFFENNGRVHIKDANDTLRIRTDPPDKVINYEHIHFFDANKNSLDINGNIVDRKSLDAHIPWSPK